MFKLYLKRTERKFTLCNMEEIRIYLELNGYDEVISENNKIVLDEAMEWGKNASYNEKIEFNDFVITCVKAEE